MVGISIWMLPPGLRVREAQPGLQIGVAGNCGCNSLALQWIRLKPCDYFGGVAVRWEHRVEDLFDPAVP